MRTLTNKGKRNGDTARTMGLGGCRADNLLHDSERMTDAE